MKKGVVIAIISFIIISLATFSFAGGGPVSAGRQTGKSATVNTDISSYRGDVGDKAARGLENIFFGWTEVPKRVVDITQETNNPFWGLFAGTFQGTLKAMARTTSGVSDVVTAPINPDGAPLISPEIDVD